MAACIDVVVWHPAYAVDIDRDIFFIGCDGLFFDVGNVYKDFNDFDAGELRYSTGLTMQWRAPVGPIVINLAYPLNDKPGDDVERIQFSFGNQF